MKSDDVSQFQHTEAPQHMPHIKCTHGTHHMIQPNAHARPDMRQPSTESCARKFVWGNKDHAKMTHAKTAPVKRDLGAKQAHAKSQSAVLSWLWCA